MQYPDKYKMLDNEISYIQEEVMAALRSGSAPMQMAKILDQKRLDRIVGK